MNILDSYVKKLPNNQNLLDLWAGEWTSKFPDVLNLKVTPGNIPLFEDVRITWALGVFGSITNWQILELGSLEGAHSYMLQNAGAKITAVESNSRAYLKSLCTQKLLKLDHVDFQLGDFMTLLRETTRKYDMVLASGVLYHMEEPIELIKNIAKVTNNVYFWTHHFDETIIRGRSDLTGRFSPVSSFVYDGETYEYSTQSYQAAMDWQGFLGGPMPISKWLTRASIIKALNKYGFTKLDYSFEQPDNHNGPSFAVCARK